MNSAGDLIDALTGQVLEANLLSKKLRSGLEAQRVNFSVNNENWSRLVLSSNMLYYTSCRMIPLGYSSSCLHFGHAEFSLQSI